MPVSHQEYLATATPKAAADLEAALLRLPEDKLDWSPMGKARTASDMIAECAILNGTTEELIKTRVFPENYDFEAFACARANLSQDLPALRALLHENTAKLVAAIRLVPEEDLGVEISMPWGPMALASVMAYPFWNMSYHEGQINYLASMLDCLD